MFYPIEIECQHCTRRVTIKVNVTDSGLNHPCPQCGGINQGIFGLELTIGRKIVLRALQELVDRDLSMSIVFAAMGIECELSRLYFKWKEIDYQFDNNFSARDEFDRVGAEEELRKIGSARQKLEAVATLLHPEGLQDFVFRPENSLQMNALTSVFTTVDPKKFAEGIQRDLFWRRNAVLHQGVTTTVDQPTADYLVRLALLVLETFRHMDEARNKRFQASMKK
jgi:hypothetical protein